VSEILNYKKGFSKSIIRQLSTYFKVSQEAFNRPYALKQSALVSIKTSRDEIDLEVVCK
jgi:HTH-type transcriptional regulator/antitoxin HigA